MQSITICKCSLNRTKKVSNIRSSNNIFICDTRSIICDALFEKDRGELFVFLSRRPQQIKQLCVRLTSTNSFLINSPRDLFRECVQTLQKSQAYANHKINCIAEQQHSFATLLNYILTTFKQRTQLQKCLHMRIRIAAKHMSDSTNVWNNLIKKKSQCI